MKILCVGDIHAKTWIVPAVRNLMREEHFDEVVFMGDYLDDWNTGPAPNETVAQQLVDFSESYGDKAVFLWGNHDLSNIRRGAFICSGYSAKNIVAANILSKLPLRFTYDAYNILFTHAGLTRGWAKSVGLDLPTGRYLGWLSKDMNEIGAESYNRTGSVRGGIDDPSPVWADLEELVKDAPEQIIQVVGHTPVHRIQRKTISREQFKHDTEIIACDTFSTYSDGSKYGDSSVLIIDVSSESICMSSCDLKSGLINNMLGEIWR